MLAVPLLALSMLLATATAMPQRSGNNCPSRCRDLFRPVCGTDNQAYGNNCKLQQAICNTPGLAKKNDGPCVFSSSQPAPAPSQQVPLPSQPVPSCQCTSSYQPVCATNGVSYDNKCILTCEGAQLRYEGPCAVPANPPRAAGGAPQIGQSVLGLIAGANNPELSAASPPKVTITPAKPVVAPVRTNDCPTSCNDLFRPVCSNEGQTYGNDCKLRLAACKDPRITKKNDGTCVKDCSISCNNVGDPVCGTDGVTYLNYCFFTIANCKDSGVKRANDGPCVTSSDRCDHACDRSINPVCGSDGRTYRNECKLKATACVTSNLIKLYNGECIEQQGSRCDTQCSPEENPVCGDDGRSYRNECELHLSACRANVRVNKDYDGPCRSRG